MNRASDPSGWPATTVATWPIDRLKPYSRNSRTHSDAQIAKIAASIREFGFTNPILATEDGTIIAGHGRHAAAKSLRMPEVPVMVASGWSPEQVRAYVIADNQIALDAGWDEDILRLELLDLKEAGFSLELTGFDADELDEILEIEIDAGDQAPKVGLADRFGIPPFSVLNAREGWWQDRKRAWLALGIRSELGRGEGIDGQAAPGGSPRPLDRMKAKRANAEPGGSKMPAADYSKNKARGDGRGRAVKA